MYRGGGGRLHRARRRRRGAAAPTTRPGSTHSRRDALRRSPRRRRRGGGPAPSGAARRPGRVRAAGWEGSSAVGEARRARRPAGESDCALHGLRDHEGGEGFRLQRRGRWDRRGAHREDHVTVEQGAERDDAAGERIAAGVGEGLELRARQIGIGGDDGQGGIRSGAAPLSAQRGAALGEVPDGVEEVPSGCRAPPTALTTTSAATTTSPARAAQVPTPPFIAWPIPAALPTVQPVPAPTDPSATSGPAASQARAASSAVGQRGGRPVLPRSKTTAVGTMGTTPAGPTGRPRPRSRSQRITPSAAPRPYAEPPVRRIA